MNSTLRSPWWAEVANTNSPAQADDESVSPTSGDDTNIIYGPLLPVTAALDGSELRPGQHRMAQLVSDAIADERHLIVQAGTGTGKTLAYLLPAIRSGSTVVVATATRALQDQLASKDLPFLAANAEIDFDWAILKGRSNYVCLQRLGEMSKS